MMRFLSASAELRGMRGRAATSAKSSKGSLAVLEISVRYGADLVHRAIERSTVAIILSHNGLTKKPDLTSR